MQEAEPHPFTSAQRFRKRFLAFHRKADDDIGTDRHIGDFRSDHFDPLFKLLRIIWPAHACQYLITAAL